ncbi:GntR family transcriptional regulator [Arthrobacter livingstonensis]|uniref:GntR family transcriptional regulator n=1 Tax=Arthrobacter livingstonensis TaxID=670078 RepID=A0A2V5L620_9MICC|nr:FCD domain-containing protein [Arthrobacter livingstonensis]PYI66835.1 GntR family transcriptional regulator [Arthrobacter livingstonensis]
MTDKTGQAAGPRAYEAVLASIEAELRAGTLRIGDRLPGERTLSETHGISRASVRDAIRILDVMGLVRTAVGSGPNSGAVLISNPAAGLSSTLRLHVASRHLPVDDIVQARILLETWAATAATERAIDEPSLARARELLSLMDDPGLDREAFHDLDAQFHVLLSTLAGNAVVSAMMESLRLSIMGYVRDSVTTDEQWSPVVQTLRAQHHGILDALSARDGTLAAQLLREHIEWFFAETGH